MEIGWHGSMELCRTFRITDQGVCLSGKGKFVMNVLIGKPILRSLQGRKYESALSHLDKTRNRAN